ncbi:Pseudouridine-metabolizing bifunctional protein C1861.05 [Bagarius yarrelli]|uniref:Pseudouridine-metabolizing bifunctional protein C1861.05 n=1 Tax=Bagarius yarrelli TaxID=175774 RepID=A0A556TNE9_BAGYA|nr:Pseudouridine-metabolizing bifunctional protein C1861.05 [Bagarius yarrelli]
MLGKLSSTLQRCISTISCRSDVLFKIHPSVCEALSEHRPVVALESTIITHGMPYPQNLSTAKEVEDIVRAEGVTPATVAVLEGTVHVGLSSDELDFLASSKTALKVSRRDMPYVISKGLSGGTTVSGTMIAAHKAGIPVFVTGGIGGVHRDGENTLDISADLTELGRTPIAVVSAGVKSILDIGRTLEFLETQGVCVATYGESTSFPAFFSQKSGYASPYNVHNAKEAAELIESTFCLGLQSGVLLAVPLPEEHAAAGQLIEDAIQAAVTEARYNILNLYFFLCTNVYKDCISRLGQKVLFISAIGTDFHSDAVLNYCKHMDTRAIARLPGHRTATYCAVITESGELSLGLGDMDIHQEIKEQYVSQYEDQLSSATLVLLDGNIPVSTIDYVCSLAKKHSVPVWYEPTDADKACKPFVSESWKALSYTSPNLAELRTMNQTLCLPTPKVLPDSLEDVLACAASLSRPLLEHLHCVVVTLGALGVLVCGEHEAGTVSLRPRKYKRKGRLCAVYYPALPVGSDETVNVSGAGDSLAGAMMVGILQGKDTDTCVQMGLLAARLSLFSPHPIAPSLTADAILLHRVHPHCWPKPTCMWMES